MTYQQAEFYLNEIKQFYRAEIRHAADDAGSMDALARQIGYERTRLNHIIKRDSFSALRRVVKAIQDIK
jgi:hypothetical protein